MFEDPMPPADSDDGPEDQVDAAESSAEQRDSGESAAEVAAGADPEVSSDPPGSRGLRLVRWALDSGREYDEEGAHGMDGVSRVQGMVL